jgi:two-component system sensor histidine kinase KdpD
MLDEGHRRRERGKDVVIGFVETHGRERTAQEIGTLEVVPRRRVEYRGATFEEMDLEAVLARRPDIALVDELAHTNVPNSGRNEKRWQDVIELLNAGIAVVSTVNIQHIGSIADAVQTITGVFVRERVPDSVVRKADQLELIDSSSGALRRRMLHGHIYPPVKVAGALGNFFKTENLVALRELALSYVADETEEELLDYLTSDHPGPVWETNERIMVALTNAPGSESVVRRAVRIAKRLKSNLEVVHVRTDTLGGSSSAEAMREVRKAAENVGGTWHEMRRDDIARAIVEFAHAHQITQIFLGASRRSRLEEITKGSVVSRVLRFAAAQGIDVHVIARYRPNPRPDEH